MRQCKGCSCQETCNANIVEDIIKKVKELRKVKSEKSQDRARGPADRPRGNGSKRD